jgi:tetratricopeptide (TPR) repeat protein
MFKLCKTRICLIIAGLIVCLAWPACARSSDAVRTKLNRFHVKVKGNQTRLIFDASGARPKLIGSPTEDGISVFFNLIATSIPNKIIKNPASAAKSVKFVREGGFFEILFREKNTKSSHRIIRGKGDRYTLVFDLSPPAKTASSVQPVQTPAEKPAEKASGGPAQKQESKPVRGEPGKKVETGELFGSQGAANLKDILKMEEGNKRDRQPAAKSQAFVQDSEQALALYREADEKFDNCKRDLVLCSPGVIDAYSKAVGAAPRSARAPLAVYRTGLANWSMGNYTKAEKLFRRVISEWPDQPVVCRCWIGIGDIQNKRRAYLEAMEAFRTALWFASEKADKASAHFELGREYLILGAPKEALNSFNLCIAQDPDYYTKKPELVRLVGESEFALGTYDKAKEDLLRYLNIQQSGPEQDLVYAKLAEILLTQGDTALAKKIYEFIGKYYTGSEGDIIGEIRLAELLERTDGERSRKIYNELCARDLSPNLRRIVYFKLAALNLRNGNLDRSLELMDNVFRGKTDISANNEMSDLREQILVALVKKYSEEKNFAAMIQLHDRYRRVFENMQNRPEVLETIANAYAELKFYPSALGVYECLLAGSREKSGEQLFKCALYAFQAGDDGKASQYAKMIRSDQLEARKSELLGQIAYREQKYADAQKYFSAVFQKKKDFELSEPDSYMAYGYTLFELKKYDDAVPILQKCLERAKAEDVDTRLAVLVRIARCYTGQNQYLKAVGTMETALGLAEGDRKNELLYEISKLYLAAAKPEQAVQNLNQIIGAQNPFWVVVAQQELNTIRMAQATQ